jgi:hypothetical protein
VGDGVTRFVRSQENGLADALVQVDELDRVTCRRVACEGFSTERMAADHVRLYDEIVDMGRPKLRVA